MVNLEILDLNNLDKKKWSKLLQNDFLNSVIFAEYYTKIGVPKFFVLIDNEEYVSGLFTLEIKRNPSFLIHFLRGYSKPIINDKKFEQEYLNLIFNGIEEYCINNNIIYFDYYNMLLNRNDNKDNLIKHNFDYIYVYNSFLIDLTKLDTELWNNISKTVRQDIKFADSLNLTFSEDNNFDEFIKLAKETYDRSNKSMNYNVIKDEYLYFYPKGNMKLYFVKDKTKYLACALIYLQSNNAIYYHGASKTNLPRGAAKYLHWKIINLLKENNYKYYDLSGGSLDNYDEKTKSIVLFKQRFGGKELICYGGIKIYSKFKKKVIDFIRYFL